jgi:MmyB-like transcription regulator ligand binding domain
LHRYPARAGQRRTPYKIRPATQLSARSEEFRALWAAHNVRLHRSGLKHFHHPVIGRMDLMFEAMAREADEGLTLTAYTAEPGSPLHDALRRLASWAATSRHETATEKRSGQPGQLTSPLAARPRGDSGP